MGRSYNRIRYAMNNEAQIASIKAKFTEFRVNGYPAGYVAQPPRGASVPVSLVPFCLYGYTNKYITRMTGRAKAQMTKLGLTEAECNIDTGAGGTAVTGKKAPSKFGAAKMVVFVPTGDVAATPDTGTTQAGEPAAAEDTDKNPLSAVTGLKYKRRLGNSYSIPFGASSTAGQQTQIEMQGFLYVKTAKSGRNVSFKPEKPA